jgi:hypothetical protein
MKELERLMSGENSVYAVTVQGAMMLKLVMIGLAEETERRGLVIDSLFINRRIRSSVYDISSRLIAYQDSDKE